MTDTSSANTATDRLAALLQELQPTAATTPAATPTPTAAPLAATPFDQVMERISQKYVTGRPNLTSLIAAVAQSTPSTAPMASAPAQALITPAVSAPTSSVPTQSILLSYLRNLSAHLTSNGKLLFGAYKPVVVAV
jgi:hypothetical protein